MWLRCNHDVSVRFQALKIIYHTISLFNCGWIFMRFVTHIIMRKHSKWSFPSLECLKFSYFCLFTNNTSQHQKIFDFKKRFWHKYQNIILIFKTDEVKRSNIYVSELSRYGRLNVAAKVFENLEKISTEDITTIVGPEISHQNSDKMAPRFLKHP